MEERQRRIIAVDCLHCDFLHGQVSGIIMGVLGTAKRGTVTAEMSIKDNMRIFGFDSTEDELNIILARLNELYEHKRIAEYKLITEYKLTK